MRPLQLEEEMGNDRRITRTRKAGGMEVEEEERGSMAEGSTIKGEDFTSLGRSLSLVMTVEGNQATQGYPILSFTLSLTHSFGNTISFLMIKIN